MSILLFSLRGVPEDEAFEIRELLTNHDFDFYETSAGNWGISTPAIWLSNTNDLAHAQQVLHDYHILRESTQKEIYLQLKKQKKNKRFIENIINNPFQFLFYLAGIFFIFYLYIKFAFEFGL